MTDFVNRSWAVYVAALVFLIWPILTLVVVWKKPALSAEFMLGLVMLLPILFIGRWDLIGYGLQYIFLGFFMFVTYRNGGWLPILIYLAFIGVLASFLWRPSREAAIELAFPLKGGAFYIAHGGNYRLLNHHRAFQSQSFALDIVRLNRWGYRAASIYPKDLESYRIFGNTVYSPCNGMVTAVSNDFPDEEIGKSNKFNTAGNHIVIRTNGVDILIAHLMHGSSLVVPGDHVVAGQPLARVGNSGNTSEPHLHIHAKRGGETALSGYAVPMRFNGRWLVRNSLIVNR